MQPAQHTQSTIIRKLMDTVQQAVVIDRQLPVAYHLRVPSTNRFTVPFRQRRHQCPRYGPGAGWRGGW